MTDRYLSPVQVEERFPTFTTGKLAGLRFTGTGPQYFKPTPKTVLYRESDIIEWIENTARFGTAPDAVKPQP